jgi:hypothetical protein
MYCHARYTGAHRAGFLCVRFLFSRILVGFEKMMTLRNELKRSWSERGSADSKLKKAA